MSKNVLFCTHQYGDEFIDYSYTRGTGVFKVYTRKYIYELQCKSWLVAMGGCCDACSDPSCTISLTEHQYTSPIRRKTGEVKYMPINCVELSSHDNTVTLHFNSVECSVTVGFNQCNNFSLKRAFRPQNRRLSRPDLDYVTLGDYKLPFKVHMASRPRGHYFTKKVRMLEA